jgi:hypothetical protein
MCDYPSECRWGKQFGIHTPVETTFPIVEVNSMLTLTAPVNTMPRGILKRENCGNINTSRQADKNNFWGALLASAERRKSAGGRGASPLSADAEKSEAREHADMISTTGGRDIDVVMKTIDPAPLDHPGSTPLAATSDSSALDSLKASVSRRRYRSVRSRSKLTDNKHPRQKPLTPRYMATELGDQVRLSGSDMLIEGFAPLHRVESRGSGYQSCSV